VTSWPNDEKSEIISIGLGAKNDQKAKKLAAEFVTYTLLGTINVLNNLLMQGGI
jgi:hypothetical protein